MTHEQSVWLCRGPRPDGRGCASDPGSGCFTKADCGLHASPGDAIDRGEFAAALAPSPLWLLPALLRSATLLWPALLWSGVWLLRLPAPLRLLPPRDWGWHRSVRLRSLLTPDGTNGKAPVRGTGALSCLVYPASFSATRECRRSVRQSPPQPPSRATR